MKRFTLLLIGLLLFVCGCATHEQMASYKSSLDKVIPDKNDAADNPEQAISSTMDRRVELKFPASIAVAKVSTDWNDRLRVETISAEELASWTKVTSAFKEIRHVHPVPSLLVESGQRELQSLRKAGASMGCEMLLVYEQVDRSVSNRNDAAGLYWTIVGLWVVPGHVVEHRTVCQAVLLDCRTGKVLGTSTGDCHLSQQVAAAYEGVQRDKLRQEAQPRAMTDLQRGTDKLLREVVADYSKTQVTKIP